VKRSTTPFCDAARVLLAEGIKPDTVFVMRHANSAADAVPSTVGVAAGLTVADDGGGKPIFRPWSPYDRAGAGRAALARNGLGRHPRALRGRKRTRGPTVTVQDAFRDVWGAPRVLRRVQQAVETGDAAEIEEQATDQAELARSIGEALRSRCPRSGIMTATGRLVTLAEEVYE